MKTLLPFVLALITFVFAGPLTIVDQNSKLPTIVERASRIKRLSTLITAVQKAGLVKTLNGKGPFTVFAPDNAAFNKISTDTLSNLLEKTNKGQLQRTLLRHVVARKVMAADIPSDTTDVPTAGGEKIEIINSADGVIIKSSTGMAKVIATDYMGSNGVIHIIDTVLTNP